MRGLKIFSLAFFSYLLISLYSNYFDGELRELIYAKGLSPSMLLLGVVYALAFFAVFALGYSTRFKVNPWFYALGIFVLSFLEYPLGPLLATLLIVAYYLRINVYNRFAVHALVIALLIPIGLYLVVGVPLFEKHLRYELVGPLVFSALLGALSIVYTDTSTKVKTLLFLIFTFIFFLGTFRSLIVLMYLAYVFDMYSRGIFRVDTKTLGSGLLLGLLVIWLSGSIEAILIRIGFTFLVFHNLVRLSLPTGIFHGSLLFSDNPRHMIAGLFGASGNYTYFFFGQAIADFGFFGLLEAYLLGFLLRESEKNTKSFAFVLAIMIYALDPGIDAFLLIFLLGALLFLKE
ncbi:hypothetical membrane protein, conserved [Thermococcus onnurineus NA1]|uniref:Hypothetical membrane protein, conserved n=1 Tax=Thermococcus onnurineus (strain NA1) TaxID=523850 RepID=B6YTA7_THEON|nr:hypothetical protein [Thermococcus onnurineus]ACJ15794.1 hypothetical membrane protein, conserved [Thermococcus onnurineus NA1]